MSAADTYVQDLARLREIEMSLRKELNQYQAEEARALEDALRQLMMANKAGSPSRRESHSSAAQHSREQAIAAGRMATEVAQQIARNEKLQENTLSRLRSAERAGHLASHPDLERLRREEVQHVRQLERVTRLPEIRRPPSRAPAAEKLRVLYITADPERDLMTELEVRQVQQALQGVKYRERVEVQLRLATAFADLIVALNSFRPHIVHFSGQTGAVFRLDDDGEVLPGAHGLDFTSLVRALVAIERPPELLLLNACGPIRRAMPVLPAVPIVVGLPDSILDTAAVVFSQQFYAAIARGESVGDAFRHGRGKVEAVLLEDDASEPPELMARNDVDADAVVLVQG